MRKPFKTWKKTFSLCAVLFWGTAHADAFKTGSGSRFVLKPETAMEAVTLVISVAGSKSDSVSFEYYFNTGGLLEMWQQFEVSLPAKGASGPLKVLNGYVFAKELDQPERMTPEYLKGFDGVAMDDFLFADQKSIDATKVGEETVDVPAGKTQATHYRRSRNGQTVDFWISDSAKPIGLVQLISTGEKPAHKYKIQLEALVKNVGAKIDPSKAKPLSEKGRGILATPAH